MNSYIFIVTQEEDFTMAVRPSTPNVLRHSSASLLTPNSSSFHHQNSEKKKELKQVNLFGISLAKKKKKQFKLKLLLRQMVPLLLLTREL